MTEDPIINLDQLENWIDEARIKCDCTPYGPDGYSKNILNNPFEYYSHDGGHVVMGLGRVWLYVTCRKCGYQWALWKLINRARQQGRPLPGWVKK